LNGIAVWDVGCGRWWHRRALQRWRRGARWLIAATHTMAKPLTKTSLARRLTEAAAELAGDDPLQETTVEAVARRLRLSDWDLIDRGVEEARHRGWLRTSGGSRPHSISVTATGREQRGLIGGTPAVRKKTSS
jgi:hypothetical protein